MPPGSLSSAKAVLPPLPGAGRGHADALPLSWPLRGMEPQLGSVQACRRRERRGPSRLLPPDPGSFPPGWLQPPAPGPWSQGFGARGLGRVPAEPAPGAVRALWHHGELTLCPEHKGYFPVPAQPGTPQVYFPAEELAIALGYSFQRVLVFLPGHRGALVPSLWPRCLPCPLACPLPARGRRTRHGSCRAAASGHHPAWGRPQISTCSQPSPTPSHVLWHHVALKHVQWLGSTTELAEGPQATNIWGPPLLPPGPLLPKVHP